MLLHCTASCVVCLKLTVPLPHPAAFRFGSAAKSRWYKAQAARNKGLLAQLGSLEEQEEGTQV